MEIRAAEISEILKKQIASFGAQADVAEAERGVSSAQAKAGPDAAEIERAQRDVAQAAIGVQVATSSLADSVSAGATDMDSVSAQLNDLAAAHPAPRCVR